MKAVLKSLLIVLALSAGKAFAQSPRALQGFCVDGGVKVMTSGLSSTTTVQASYPLCTVTVYLTGTTTLATIYADGNSNPLSNPFTAKTNASWLFFAAPTACYDIILSGGSPIPLPAPVPIVDQCPGSGGGGGSQTFYSPVGQVPSGAVNGTNVTFILSQTPANGSLILQKNGQVINNGYGYSLSGTTLTLDIAPQPVDSLYANYFSVASSSTTVYQSVGQIPSGVINGSNTGFTLTSIPVTGTLLLQLNGQVLSLGTGYAISGATLTLASAPQTGDSVYANYFTTASSNMFVPMSEVAAGPVDGANVTFLLSHTPESGSLLLQLNGQVLESGLGYTVSGTTIVMSTPPSIGDVLYATYFR